MALDLDIEKTNGDERFKKECLDNGILSSRKKSLRFEDLFICISPNDCYHKYNWEGEFYCTASVVEIPKVSNYS